RLGPERIDFEPRRLYRGLALRVGRSVERRLRDAEDDQEPENARTDEYRAVPRQLPHVEPRFRRAVYRVPRAVGQTTPWLSFVTAAMPLYMNLCSRLPSYVSVV